MKVIVITIIFFSISVLAQYSSVTEISQFEDLSPKIKSKLLSGMLLKNVIDKNKKYLSNEIPKEQANEVIAIYYKDKPNKIQLSELEQLGITYYINTWTPPMVNHPYGFIIAKMPTDKFMSLLNIESVEKVATLEHQHYPNNNSATAQIKANELWAQGYTGTSIKIAVLDSGLDSFYGGSDLPSGYQRRDYSNYPTSIDTICENTVSGHGTHVTGSVLGRGTLSASHNSNNGNAPFKGSAPNADLVFLKIGSDATAGASSAAIIASVQSAVDTFNAKIISMSYGGWYDHHDGSSATEQRFDWAFNQGVISFVAAGNDAAGKRHFSGTVPANGNSGFIQFTVPSSQRPTFNLVYFDGTARSNLYMQYYNSSYVQITQIDEYTTTESTRGTESRYYQSQNNFSSGTYYLRVFNPTSQPLTFHIYEVFRNGIQFTVDDPFYTIGQPSSADEVIAVGAYVSRKQWWNYLNEGPYSFTGQNNQFEIANFSSRGPRVDEVLKPNITAPGTAIISLRDTDVLTLPNNFWIDNDGINGGAVNYYIMQGTSMACPIAAGAAALYYHKYPSATPSQVRTAIQNYASKSVTEVYPNNKWGYGKLDIFAATNSSPTIDGHMSEPAYNIIGVFSSGRNGFGDDNDLKTIRYYTDATDIYIGISGEITSNDNILLFLNFSNYSGRGNNTLQNGGSDAGVFKHLGSSRMDFDVDFALAFNEGNSSTNFYIDACRYGSSTPVISTGYIGNTGSQIGASASFNISSVFGGTGNMTIAYRNDFAADSLSGIEMKIPISAFAGVNNVQNIQMFAVITNSSGFFSNECIPGDPGAANPGNNPNFSSMSGGPFHTGFQPLPVQLSSFEAMLKNSTVLLNWTTETEVSSLKFEIERSSDFNWQKIGEVSASGNSNSPKNYQFVDKNPIAGLNYYRLKMIDIDGSFEHSDYVEVNVPAPLSFELYQNYPNPFNPTTKIRWQSPVSGWQTLKVYDLLGREVVTLVDEFREAGNYEVSLEARNLSSGVYIYRLTTGDYSMTRSMLIIK